jgi:hypothetical protein
MSKIVFSNGNWIKVFLPKYKDPSWTNADEMIFATVWVAAKEIKGDERATQIAEAVVYKRMYPGLLYDKRLETDIKECIVRDHEETS